MSNKLNFIVIVIVIIIIGTGSSSNNILNFKLVRLGVYMVKLCHENMLILRCILPPPKKKIESSPEKKIDLPPLENLEHPDKELNSLGIILIP